MLQRGQGGKGGGPAGQDDVLPRLSGSSLSNSYPIAFLFFLIHGEGANFAIVIKSELSIVNVENSFQSLREI